MDDMKEWHVREVEAVGQTILHCSLGYIYVYVYIYIYTQITRKGDGQRYQETERERETTGEKDNLSGGKRESERERETVFVRARQKRLGCPVLPDSGTMLRLGTRPDWLILCG